MRDIKFRALRNKVWYYFDFNSRNRWARELLELMAEDENLIEFEAFVQYTGLKDKQGHEIYEGDVLVYDGMDIRKVPFHCFYEMRFGEYDNGESYDDNTSGYGWWLLEFKMTRDSGEIELKNQVYDYRGLFGLENMEVIGNIYEGLEEASYER